MEQKIEDVIAYIAKVKDYHLESIKKFDSKGIVSYAEAYSYGFDKGAFSHLEFIEYLLKR